MAQNDKLPSGLVLKDLSLEKERSEIIGLLDVAFGSKVFGVNLLEAVWHPSIFRNHHTKIATVAGKVAGVVVIGERTISFPPVEISAATIGPVATHPSFQKMGVCSALMKFALNFIKSSNIEITYTQGIPNFYSRFGFFPYLAKSKISVNVADVRQNVEGQIIDFKSTHLPELKKIYERVTKESIFSAKRDAKVWSWLTGPAQGSYYFYKPQVFVGNNGKVHGYFSGDLTDPMNFREVVVDTSIESCRLAISLLSKYALNLGASEFEIKLADNSFLMSYLKQDVKGTFLQFVQSDGGSMLKIFDSVELFQRLIPFFNSRLKGLGLKDSAFSLRMMSKSISFRIVNDEIKLEEGVTSECFNIPNHVLPGLITGYYSFEEIAPFCDFILDDTGKLVFKSIFPKRYPFLYQGDNY